jgi:uncharacterized membrane protein
MLYSGAIFNWVAALILFAPTGLAQLMGISPVPDNSMFNHISVLAIFGFGLGYWWAGQDPEGQQGIIRLGMVLKIGIVAVIYGHAIWGDANLIMAFLVSFDALYAALFAHALSRLNMQTDN